MTGRPRLGAILTLAALTALPGACDGGPGSAPDRLFTPTSTTGDVALPPPDVSGGPPLNAAIARRRSVRDFRPAELGWEQVGQLFWAAQGITGDSGRRAAPSAGALYPLEMYVVLSEGVFQYDPGRHQAVHRIGGDLRERLAEAALSQDAVRLAPATFVITGVVSRTAGKYGPRAERYVHLEAGHAAQNLLLEAVALSLAAVPVGAFSDDDVRSVLRLGSGQQPIYLLPVGYPVQ